jgi:hypothetical protein
MIQFLSIVPISYLQDVVVGGLLNKNELRTILLHHFAPTPELAFGDVPFDDSISIGTFAWSSCHGN